MLEVDIKIIPYGIREGEHLIGRMTIWNDATGTRDVGNYGYKITTDAGETYRGDYKNFPRKEGFLKLINNILNEVL